MKPLFSLISYRGNVSIQRIALVCYIQNISNQRNRTECSFGFTCNRWFNSEALNPVLLWFDMQEVAQFRGTESAVAVVSETEPGDSLSKPA